jgi:hypothetical protein
MYVLWEDYELKVTGSSWRLGVGIRRITEYVHLAADTPLGVLWG